MTEVEALLSATWLELMRFMLHTILSCSSKFRSIGLGLLGLLSSMLSSDTTSDTTFSAAFFAFFLEYTIAVSFGVSSSDITASYDSFSLGFFGLFIHLSFHRFGL